MAGISRAFHSSTAISCFTASVAPLLDRRIMKSTTTTKKAQAVFTAESVMMVCRLSDSPRAVIARMVPVADVMPGIIETRMPPKLPVITDRIEDFFVLVSRTGIVRSCLGIVGLVKSEVRSVGVPKRPARAGNNTGEESPMGESTES